MKEILVYVYFLLWLELMNIFILDMFMKFDIEIEIIIMYKC